MFIAVRTIVIVAVTLNFASLPSFKPFVVAFIVKLLDSDVRDLRSFVAFAVKANSFAACTSSSTSAITDYQPSYCIKAEDLGCSSLTS